MRTEYDLSKMKFRRNPYAARLKKPVTIRLGADIINYFKSMAKEMGVPYQNLINIFFEEVIKMGTMDEVLSQYGWRKVFKR